MKSSSELRQQFMNYYRQNNHKFMPPSKVYNNDPSLMFINAGMNQIKDVFLGKAEPKSTQLMNYQICIRAGGKHNDLDDVGRDSYHLTTFEMLGSWSLNSYDRRTSITLAYGFLVDIMKLDKERLYITYYEGNDDIGEDIETKDIWKSIVESNKVLKGSAKDNLWKMADEGPCGMSTEIHYDLIGGRDASTLVNCDDPTVVEIWNIVFTEYNQIGDKYLPLGKLFIDTGMGLERLSMIVNNKPTLYYTDSFTYLIGYAQAISGCETFQDKYDGNMTDISYRIFADHVRTVVNALFDGVEFGNNRRGHVLKKIFRRCLTHYYIYLNRKIAEPIMHKPIIKCMITDILTYFLKMKHDSNKIQAQLVDDEKLYLGKIYNCKKGYKRLCKKFDQETVTQKLKQEYGVDQEIIRWIDVMQFRLENK